MKLTELDAPHLKLVKSDRPNTTIASPPPAAIHFYIDAEESEALLKQGDIVDMGSDKKTQLTPGFASKVALLGMIDKYRPSGPKFEDLIHLYVSTDAPESWHGELGHIYKASAIGPTITVDLRWLVQLETWHALLTKEFYEEHFKKPISGEWLKFAHQRIEKMVGNFWSGNVFDHSNYHLSPDEARISIRPVDQGPLPNRYKMILARKVQILEATGKTGEDWL